MQILAGHRRMVQSVTFSADGRLLLSTGGFGSEEARLFDRISGKTRWAYDERVGRRLYGAALTPEGDRLLVCDHPDGCRLLDVATLAEVPFPLRDAPVRPQAHPWFSPDGTRLLACGSLDSREIYWWSYPSWEPLPAWTAAIEWAFRYFQPVFSPDGLALVDIAHGGIALHDVATGQERRRFPLAIKQGQATMAVSPDGRLLAAGSGLSLLVWDVTTGAEVARMRQKRKYFLGAAFTPDGRYLGTVGNEETVKMWDTSGWHLVREYAWQVGGLKCLAFSRDGQVGVAGSDKKKIVVWDLDD
jgi:WD40 repeat protein